MSNKFPLKLMSILDSHEHQDIISWLPHGRGFMIRDKKRLADLVLPKYFKESKYTSFTRRLNRWNFTIQTHGHKEASYFHPMFIRGDPQRVLEMHPAPQSAKSRRESRYIDDRRRMELGLDYATAAASGVGGMTLGGVGMTTSSTMMPPPPPMMEHYELSNQDPMSRMMMGGQSNNTHAHHPTMEYVGPPSSNSNTTIPAGSTQQGPPQAAMDYSLGATTTNGGPPNSSFNAKGPMLSPAHHYTMQVHSSTNSDMMPMNRPMQNHAMHSSFSNTNHQSRLPPQLYTNPAMMHPGNHPGTTNFTTASSSRNVTGGDGMYPGTQNFQPHPVATNTATHGNTMNSNSNSTAMMHHHPTVSNVTNRTVAQQQGHLNEPVMMHGHPNGPRRMQGQPNGPMMQGQLNGGNMMQGQPNGHMMQGQQNGLMMQGQQRGPMMQGQPNRHMMQGHPNNVPMMQGQPNNGPMMQGHPNNGPMMPNDPHFRYSATNNTHKGPMMQGHPSFMMHQNAMGMHSNNQFREYPPNQRFSPYQPFPVGHYETPNGYPQSQYMNHVNGGMIPHGQNSMAASYHTPSTANNGGLTMESNNAPLPEKGMTIESRTKGRKGAKLKSKRSSINSMTNDTGVQDRADEDNAEDRESHSFPRTEMSESANVNRPGTNDQIKDDSSVNNMVDKLPETSENEKQSSSSQNDDVNFNEEKIDFSMKGSRNHHGDCSSLDDPPTKRVKENN